jgi:hypothetical protein
LQSVCSLDVILPVFGIGTSDNEIACELVISFPVDRIETPPVSTGGKGAESSLPLVLQVFAASWVIF